MTLKDWHLEYFLKPESHQIGFFVVSDSVEFSFEKQQKTQTHAFAIGHFKINLLSCKDLATKNKDFNSLLFRFKKHLLQVI